MSVKHGLWINRDALPKFEQRCACGWRSQQYDHQGDAMAEGRTHAADVSDMSDMSDVSSGTHQHDWRHMGYHLHSRQRYECFYCSSCLQFTARPWLGIDKNGEVIA
jgi:hypothetical protein